jgi:hypothetical protein
LSNDHGSTESLDSCRYDMILWCTYIQSNALMASRTCKSFARSSSFRVIWAIRFKVMCKSPNFSRLPSHHFHMMSYLFLSRRST